MAVGTIKSRKVKTSKKVGTLKSGRAKPVTKAEVERIVAESIYMSNPFVQIYNGGAALVGGVYDGVTTTLQSILDSLAYVAGKVWVFLGTVYDTVVSYTKAVLNWLGEQIAYAVGLVRSGLEYVYEFVGSMTVDWLAVNGHVVNLMCAAASFGVAITAGAAVGLTSGAAVATLVGVGTASKVTALLMAAITANCVAPVAYTLFKSGVSRELIGESLAEAEEKAQKKPAVTVNAVAVTPAAT